MFPRYEEGKFNVKRGIYDANNQPKRATFKYEQEGWFCLGGADVESKDRTIIGKCCPVFNYADRKIVTMDDYKK